MFLVKPQIEHWFCELTGESVRASLLQNFGSTKRGVSYSPHSSNYGILVLRVGEDYSGRPYERLAGRPYKRPSRKPCGEPRKGSDGAANQKKAKPRQKSLAAVRRERIFCQHAVIQKFYNIFSRWLVKGCSIEIKFCKQFWMLAAVWDHFFGQRT